MPIVLNDFKTKMEAIIKDDGNLIDHSADIPLFLQDALKRYNQDHPLIKVYDVTPPATGYEFDLPSDWADGFSKIDSVEYTRGTLPGPSYLYCEDYMIYRSPAGLKLKFFIPIIFGKTARVNYIAMHTVSSSASTVYLNDFDALSNLAGSICLRAMADKTTQLTNSTITGSSIDYQRKTSDFGTRADELENLYNIHFNKGKEARDLTQAAERSKQMDLRLSTDETYLTHNKQSGEVL